MPALGQRIPAWVDFITIAAEGDDAGRKGALGLAERLRARDLHHDLQFFEENNREAA